MREFLLPFCLGFTVGAIVISLMTVRSTDYFLFWGFGIVTGLCAGAALFLWRWQRSPDDASGGNDAREGAALETREKHNERSERLSTQ